MAIKDEPMKKEINLPVKKEMPQKIRKEPEPDYVVYIGPSLRAMITKNAIIRKQDLNSVELALERYPDIKHLLIPGDQLGTARAQIRNPDSFLAQVYGRLAQTA